MRRRIALKWLAMLVSVPLVPGALASGSYTLRPPRPPSASSDRSSRSTIDQERYRLGQKVFGGKVPLTASEPAASQMARLEVAQARLPANVAKKKTLTSLAGKLNEEQLSALEYYVSQRYAQ